MILLILSAVFFITLYVYTTRTFDYWKKRGVKHDRPIPFFGTNKENFLMKKSITQMAADAYWKYPTEKIVGFYRCSRPELVIRDPVIAKRILVTDFAYFYPRGINPHKTVIEPLMRSLFFADGDLWKLLRQRMTPAFTSGKLKAMFPLIVERAVRLQSRVYDSIFRKKQIDARDLMARYTTDFIGACGFGLDADSLNDEDSAFRKLGAKIFDVKLKDFIVVILKMMFPETFKHLRFLSRMDKELIALVDEIQKQRNYQPSGRQDFIDLLLETQKKGVMIGESIEKVKLDGKPEIVQIHMDSELFAAQVFVFFAAGFETSSSATSFTLLQLAYHPEVQKKVQQNIDTVLSKYNNLLCYDAVKEMNYLECAFREGMRMFPSLGQLVRRSARKYTIPEVNVTIDEDVGIIIPLQAMQNDPQYFENPEEFRPERFLPENIEEKNRYVYLPFGVGPRACIGERLGLMQSLAGLAAVLMKFTVEPTPNTVRRPKVEPKSGIVQSIQGGIPLYFRERIEKY
uniref:unspecific monooxygenase n=1 Tax=Carposina sasakii TaxID=252295 RepID=A0A411AG12_CARSA|nr:cytochrome P450 CYP6AB14 [Carposina sasakii]